MNTQQIFRIFPSTMTPYFIDSIKTAYHYRSHFFAAIVAVSLLFISACGSNETPAQATDTQTLYSQAKAEYDAKNYSAAKADFNKVLNNNPDAASKENATYYIALCDYYLLNYAMAKTELEAFITNFGTAANNYYAAKYWLGRSELKLGNYDLALAQFNDVIASQTSVYVDNAAFQVGNVYYEWGVSLLTSPTPDFATTYPKFDSAVNTFDAFLADTNYATSTYQDDVAYFRARSLQRLGELYQLLNGTGSSSCSSETTCYDSARATFAWFDNDPAHPELVGSSYADSALYYSGRSYQVQSNADFAQARAQFQKLINSTDPVMLNSTVRDDAQYQIAMTYYDTAKTNVANIINNVANESTATTNFISAINAFNVLLQSPGNGQTFIDSSRWDNALYFRGRSFERFTLMVEASVDPVNAETSLLDVTVYDWTNAINSVTPNAATSYTITTMYDASRAAFQALLTYNNTSIYADNAALETGVLYQSQAGSGLLTAATNIEKFTWLAQAETAYTSVTSLGNCINDPACINADNAAYNKAKVYDDTLKINQGDLAVPNPFNMAITYSLARSEFQNFVNTYTDNTGAINSVWVDNAYYHIADLRKTEGEKTKDVALLELAINDYANVILSDEAARTQLNQSAQYVDNAIYHIGKIYHDYSPASNPSSTGCTLANDWLQAFFDISGVAGALPTLNVPNYVFSFPTTSTPLANTNINVPVPLTTTQTFLDTAQIHLDAYAAALNDPNLLPDCGNVDNLYLGTTATIAPPAP